jgi:hypothetical protein
LLDCREGRAEFYNYGHSQFSKSSLARGECTIFKQFSFSFARFAISLAYPREDFVFKTRGQTHYIKNVGVENSHSQREELLALFSAAHKRGQIAGETIFKNTTITGLIFLSKRLAWR